MEDLSLRSRLTPYPGLGRSMGCNSRTSHSLLPGPLLKRLAAAACRIHSEPLTSVGLVMLLGLSICHGGLGPQSRLTPCLGVGPSISGMQLVLGAARRLSFGLVEVEL